jgi:hypothetical protein
MHTPGPLWVIRVWHDPASGQSHVRFAPDNDHVA